MFNINIFLSWFKLSFNDKYKKENIPLLSETKDDVKE